MPKWTQTLLDLYLTARVKRQRDAKFGSVSERPQLFSISPINGSHTGGTTVTITGRNLTGTSSVVFGATAAASFTVDSDTQVTAVSPAHAAAAIVVGATTPNGSVGTGVTFTFT